MFRTAVFVATLGCIACEGFAQVAAVAEKPAKPIALVAPEHLKKYDLEKYQAAADRWAGEIAKMASTNDVDGSEDSVLFLGSSSIRIWKSVEEDLGNWKAVRRGYGGAKFCDTAIYAPNLVKGLKFQAAGIFVANDITGGKSDKSPEEVARLAKSVIESVRAENPTAPVLLISITATPSRFAVWPTIEQANEELRKLSESMDKVYFLDTKAAYLTEDGKPIPDYFIADMLHQNESGYKLWGRLIAEKLASIDGLKSK